MSALDIDELINNVELSDSEETVTQKKSKETNVYPLAINKPPAEPLKTVKGEVQTSPPKIAAIDFFEDGIAFEGQIMEYPLDSNTYRITSAELREAEKVHADDWNDMREAAEAHRQARHDIQQFIRPGLTFMEISRRIEANNLALLGSKGFGDFDRGIAFPTGLSINHIAAHDSPNTGNTAVLGHDDVLKIDFGSHVKGRIIDSAFTVHFNPKFDPLVEAVQEATEAGIKAAGIDVRLCDIGASIQEVMESYEVELGDKIYPVRCLENLNGHNIFRYKIHGDKSVPIVANKDTKKMEEGEMFAIETFGTTGRGYVLEDGVCSHFSLNQDFKRPIKGSESAAKLYKNIQRIFGTLPFCRKWLDDLGYTRHVLALNHLVKVGAVTAHPPLVDVKGSYTAQFEHTILLRPTCKEVLSRGYDY